MTDAYSKVIAPFWCPWCEDTIDDESGYLHAYQHRDMGPYTDPSKCA